MTKRKGILSLMLIVFTWCVLLGEASSYFTTKKEVSWKIETGSFEKPYLTSGENFNKITSPVKNKIQTVEFMNRIPDLSDYETGVTKFDVSKEQNKTVIAWVDGTKMYVGGMGGIIADESLNTMFSYYTALTDVKFKDVLDTTPSNSAYNMFLCCANLLTTDIANLDMKGITNYQMMFANCDSIEKIDISAWNMSSAKNLYGMFLSCDKLAQVYFGEKNLQNVENFGYMFSYCGNLADADFSRVKTQNGINYDGMFLRCQILGDLDLSGFKMRADSSLNQMFGYMNGIRNVYVSSNWSEVVKGSDLPFWRCRGLTGADVSDKEGIDMANYNNGGYFTYRVPKV